MAQIKLTLPLSIGGLLGLPITKQQHWAHCILDIEEYVSELYRYRRLKEMDELQEVLWLRSCEYIWHAYHCADPLASGAWWRFELEQDLRFVWTKWVSMYRWDGPIEGLKLDAFRQELRTIVMGVIAKRQRRYAKEACRFGVKQSFFAIDKIQELLQYGREEACWGLVDFDTLAFFPIEGQSIVKEWAQEADIIPSQALAITLSPPEQRKHDITYTGEDARECLRYAIENVDGHGELFVAWFVSEKYREVMQLCGNPSKAIKLLANYIIEAGQLFMEELFNTKGTGLLQLLDPKYRQAKLVPWKKLLGDIVEFMVDKVNAAAVDDTGRRLSALTLMEYMQRGRFYRIGGDEDFDEEFEDDSDNKNDGKNEVPLEWNACFYAICPRFMKKWGRTNG